MRFAVVIALSLVGCATTPAELREREIVATYKTAKAPVDVAGCLADRFAHVGAPMIADRDGAKIVTINHNGSTVLMWTIANGSVAVRRANSLIGIREGTESCV